MTQVKVDDASRLASLEQAYRQQTIRLDVLLRLARIAVALAAVGLTVALLTLVAGGMPTWVVWVAVPAALALGALVRDTWVACDMSEWLRQVRR